MVVGGLRVWKCLDSLNMFRILGLVTLIGVLSVSNGNVVVGKQCGASSQDEGAITACDNNNAVRQQSAALRNAVIVAGQCDQNIASQPNFDPVRFTGRWYEIASYYSDSSIGTCNGASYSLNPDGSVAVVNREVVDQTLREISGFAVLASNDGSAILNVTLEVIPNVLVQQELRILSTDYDNYAVSYSCININANQKQVLAWIVSRTKQPNTETLTAINQVIAAYDDLDSDSFLQSDQSDAACFYFPEPETGKEVVFPGQCDNNIAAVANFDVNRFLGTWYEIEAYPKDDQPGECISHLYSASTTSAMELTSIQVVDQIAAESKGAVNFTSIDGSGRLSITFEFRGNVITIPFWILGTDYDTYALAYTCVNIDSDFRGIYAWKLSRTRSLSADANTIINIITNNNVVLDNAYFEPTDHSDQACFAPLPFIPAGNPIILSGQCDPNIPVVLNFDAVSFTGRWNEIASYYSESATGTCSGAQYGLNADGSVSVVNREIIDQSLRTISGFATVASNDGSAILDVILEVLPSVFIQQDLRVLATDYTNYAISYSCQNINATQKRVFAWIVSRTRQFSPEIQATVNSIISSYPDLNNGYFTPTDQSDEGCFYFPEPRTSEPVIFPGSCDLNIPAMPNFDPVAYMGLWYEIEGYPSTFQQGTCNNAFYTLVDGVVIVYNTQVIGQNLDEIYGTGVIASTDGSAKLTVTFPVDGNPNVNVSTSYWVLDTDYTTYALVYTCEDLGNDQRAVFSWKLGRSKQLPAQASVTINNIINTIPVLDNRYYEVKDQTAEGCFYIPTPEPGKEVVFPGTCNDNIAAVYNFDLTQFLGTWYEVAAYPKDDQPGQCISHEYAQLTGTTASLASSQVNDQIRYISNGNITYASNDGSGRLVITINVDGEDITIPFWILAVDYNNFALAYSCVNIDNDFRGIYAWKLSRSRELSVIANVAINNIIANSDVVLDNAYFEPTDQSDVACFSFPSIPAGQPIILPGQCDRNITVVQNFDPTRFIGTWYEYASYFSESATGTCNTANYAANPDGSVAVINSEVLNQSLRPISGLATVASTDGSAVLDVTLEIFPGTFVRQELLILASDYDSFAISYSCDNIDTTQKRVYAWIVSRTRQITPEALLAVNQVINNYVDLNNAYFRLSDQSDEGCFYYPEPVSGQPVIFPGTCDQNIPAMPNFDPVAYMGLWHEIEGYPSTFQQGTCNNAFYTLNEGVVDVYNTQVIGQTLDEIDGRAVIASTDGSAKLTVTFPVDGNPNVTVSTSYWVLDTDYVSYALVYTCEDLGNDNRAVFSWKLSRSKQLSAAASTTINNIISTIPVLDARYYQPKNQTIQGCFYFPTPAPGKEVVFPGQCSDDITAVPNFNLALFAGTWFEIEAYPKDDQPGECINHEYALLSANNLTITSTQIADNFLAVSNGVVGFEGNDGSGKLSITFTFQGNQITIPFWILAIDYNSFAIAYSCVNANEDFRGIWAWKLSRTRELTIPANLAINSIINNIDVLDNVYFEPTDHSDQACAILPEIPAGQPIILDGQCDPNIPVVQNFDASRYTGRWRLIETYPSEFQFGTCNDATYTLNNGVVDVLNSQVINQTLDTITGTAVLATNDGSAKLLVTFPLIINNESTLATTEYWILDTDYDSYSLVYTCVNINNLQRQVWSWKMSRTSSLTPTAVENINNVVSSIDVLNNRYYEAIDQSDAGCFYFPEVDSTRPVVFRGQCDNTIPAMPNFDPTRYTGLWYEIEGYPSTFQQGTCNNALYNLVGGVVDVYNTQVINQTLDEINGIAVIASTDGSAKLTVTFPVDGNPDVTVSTSYWVLDTDYDTYSLVYTCENLSDDLRAIFSWKLSRTKQLSAAANNVMTNIINTIDVLDQRYYDVKNQTEEGCFFYPEAIPGEPVYFPGTCDESLATVSDLDVNRFGGFWYEISAYPKDEQQGTCVNYNFTVQSPTAISLISTQIIDLNYDVTTATMIRAGTDNSRFTISINTGGNTIVIPYWILATDYDNYALAYSCVNIPGTDIRGVYSWKLSRTPTLPAASNNAIAQVIAPIQVLEEPYFQPTGQSEDACFYLPEVVPNQPVDLPGQCDTSIPAMPNFDPTRYTGRWFDIESYFDTFQDGTCNDALYTLTPEGIVDVYNTQVVNQTLDTINGTAVLASTDGSGKLLVTFPVAGTDFSIQAEYWILDTDYDSYSLVYSCTNNPADNTRRVYSWKLSRTRQLTDNARTAINNVVQTINVLDQRYYIIRDHSPQGCFYYPEEFSIGQAVFFPGQCDESIQPVQNFDAVRYTGFWYDVGSYPQEFQFGSCPTATYTFNPVGFVEVYNTQVFNQTLDDINGIAVVSSTDGSAKLSVTFPIAGTDLTIDSPYWVLATDYDNYALVYACLNFGPETRRVTSWKLSRQPTLSAAGTAVINNVIDSIDVLDERYFLSQSHTEESCSYVPRANGEPVVFWGQCDNNIQAVANFDLLRFAGSWYEISAYPKDEQEGTCVRYDFTVSSASAFSLISNQVVDGVLDITNASVVQVATDGTARFTINLNVNGNEIVIPYWIIATDYESYALAYTCVDYFNARQGVFAWKLSRSLDLSNAANTAITQTINNIAVLDEQYFEQTDQSANGCFVIPEPTPGEPTIFEGQCDESIPVMQNFDPVRYQGKWYDIESYYDTFQDGTCNDAEYTLTPEGVVDVYNTQVVNQTLDVINGTARLATTDGSAKLIVTFPVAGTDFTIDAEYWVLDTDYDSYSFVYSCTNLNNNRRLVYSWKLSRTRQLTTAATSAINDIVSRVNVLDNSFYIIRDHSAAACFYYPDFAPGTAVNFRGQCEESLPVVQNFDVLRYGGFWYDIASYPQQFQFGSCPTANYTFNPAGFVEVYNTQVFNQSLDDIIGVAVVASTDGSAKLSVTFPVIGADQAVGFIDWPYWVLATDYDNYALVYSCVNLNSETRRVTSWKLSRQPTLSDVGNNVINSFVNNVDVLDERYFQPQGHDDETCFYFPQFTGEPVIFPGQCDDNIETVSNFDFQRFAGSWNELAAYPKDEQQGDCVNYDFSVASANSFSLISSQVLNGTLDTTNAVLVQTSNDSSARFTITLNVNGLQIVIPYWIVATDYDNYALAYSCVNYQNNRRGVYGWKLSRTKEFSLISNTAIDLTMSRVDVLDERYFVNVDQSNDGCFYLPDVASNTPVVFRGQCDNDISVVQNFDPVRYQGQWYDIESYYDTFQMGSCNDALYTLTPQGTVDVYNTQVVNQALDTINGTAVLATTDGSGKLLVTFPVAGTSVFINAEYWILDTDYDSYSFVYSCTNLPNDFKQVFSWKLSRTRQLSNAAQTAISNVINRVNVLNDRYYVSRDHSEDGCFYYPNLVPGQAVSFRGQCNENLAVVQNFDAARYMGLWYDFASYPQEFQFGTCSTANYTLNPLGFVEVYNTQVVGQQLDEINGTAVVASTDGSAKLSVTFPIAGTNAFIVWPYWVLATDYDNYALVYSCMNINTERYRVTSWKLSRQPALSAASNTAINQVVNNVNVLDDRYYQINDNSEEACRFYPRIEDGPIILPGVCDNQTVVSNFNVNAFTGTWYEIAQFRSEYTFGTCASTSFEAIGGSLSLTHNIVLEEQQVTITGILGVPNDGSGALSATFVLPNGETRISIINVLATDYTSYALLHSCNNIGTNSKQLYSWKLSRTRAGLPVQAESAVTALVSATDELFEAYYVESDQSNDACFYYPDVDGTSASSIVLPGTCPENINGAPNFNAAAYLGRWYEIESLPVPSQQGDCARAEYSLGSGVVDVYNTIVYNETLEVQPGSAVVASTDGSGVLDVTFVLTGGVVAQANYYILDTDYINYALVYSCRNLEDGNSQVSSWILSRQRTLATQFYNLVEAVIENTRGLRRQYYKLTNQSDDACFYVPAATNANQGVVFPGQCDENISAIDGFDLEKYLGWWHEIEAYPTNDNSGTCPSTVVRNELSQYFADDTRVNGLAASVTTSLLQISSNGRLRKFLPSGEISDVYVLQTDYENYALLYSCENIDTENRRVWSAKHSRTRQLSNQNQIEIQSTVDGINVLRSQFYLPQDQSDEACFHYPETLVGGRVIIPGQCDQNIPVVQNFDPVQYGGTWYQIEKYPQQWESGTCVGARYTLNEQTGVVNVVNWEVINGVLDTIEGGAVLISTDGSARLLVTLPVVGTNATTTFELNVLATDYVSYAFAYSCENINAYQRSIGAWKLSRTRTLPIAGASAINGIIAQRPELYDPYFVAIEQSDTCTEPEVISELTPSSGISLQSSIIIFLVCFLLQSLF